MKIVALQQSNINQYNATQNVAQTTVSLSVGNTQSEICSKEANEAIRNQLNTLIKLNAKEKFIDKKITLSKIQKDLSALYEIQKFIDSNELLKTNLDVDYGELCEYYFDGLKYRNCKDIDKDAMKKILSELSTLYKNPETEKLTQKIDQEILKYAFLGQTDIILKLNPEMIKKYCNIFNCSDLKAFFKNLEAEKIVYEIIENKNPAILEKNAETIKNLINNPEYAFLKEIKIHDPNILRYDGDIKAFFDLLKSYQNNLLKNEKLRYFIDNESKETVIRITDEVDETFKTQKNLVFDKSLKMVSMDTTVLSVNKNNQRVQNIRTIDLLNNTEYRTKLIEDKKFAPTSKAEDKAIWILDTQIKEVKNKDGKTIKREIIKESGIDGAYNIKTIDESGKIKTKAMAYKNSDGSVYIEKNIESTDGTKTRVRFKNRVSKYGEQTAEIMDYKITNAKGEEISKRENIIQQINNLHTESYVNGEKHKIYYLDKDVIRVVNQKTGKISVLNLNELVRNGDTELKGFIKTLPGSTLETISETVKAIDKVSQESAACIPQTKYLETAADRFVIDHEIGHLKSFINGNFLQEQKTRVVADFFDAEKNRLSQDPELVKIYKEEMANFVKNVPRRIRNFAQYFSDYAHTQTNNGLEEAFAEIEALINNVKIPKFVYRRAHLLQENFPKTIAYLMQRRI